MLLGIYLSIFDVTQSIKLYWYTTIICATVPTKWLQVKCLSLQESDTAIYTTLNKINSATVTNNNKLEHVAAENNALYLRVELKKYR